MKKMHDKETNIGGYDVNYKYDRKAVNYLDSVLLDSEYIIPHLESGDKMPNFDGHIELCGEAERKIIPIGRFDVQIKSLNCDYRNDNTRYHKECAYKYSCDTKIINVVLQGVTCNPVLLLLVDSQNKRIFWKHMSIEYCLELDVGNQIEKTMYFDDIDELTDPNEWYRTLHKIYIKHNHMQKNEKDNYFLLSNMCPEVPDMLQETSDYINHLLDNELWFIKQVFFSDVWKIGIAYLGGNAGEFSCLGLYKIKKGKNDLFIKQFKEGDEYFCSIHYGGSYCLDDIVRQTLEHWIEEFFKRENHFLYLYPDIVLQELFFEELDSAIAIEEMTNNSSQHVTLGWREEYFVLDEINSIADKVKKSTLLLSVKQEFEKRGFQIVNRPWEKLVDYHIYKKDEHCTQYEEDGDRIQTDQKNMLHFMGSFKDFYESNKRHFGNKSVPVFNLKNTYIMVLDKEMDGYQFGVKETENFALEVYRQQENMELYEELKTAMYNDEREYIRCGGSRLVICDYSWHKLWRVFNRYQFLKYIGVHKEHGIALDYLVSI